jgi:hypothetical protein
MGEECSRLGELRNAYKLLVEKSHRKKQQGRYGDIGEDGRIILKRILEK